MSRSVPDFMKSPLVTWVKTVHDGNVDYKSLCEGIFLYNVWLQIDPHPLHQRIINAHSTNLDRRSKIKNLNFLFLNIKAFYEDVLGQLVVLRLPDIVKLSKSTDEEHGFEEMQLLLLLILGSAVQCDRKQMFIENIKTLDLDSQHKIVECIQQVTDNPEAVWSGDWNRLQAWPEDDQEQMYSLLVRHLQRLVRERDELFQRLVNLVIDQERSSPVTCSQTLNSPTGASDPDKPHLVVELADAKSRLRRLQHEVEEKNEVLSEMKEELESTKENLNRMRQENLELIQESRTAKAYRDEIDILKERVHKVDRLENEIQRYKDKMNELEYYRSRVEELREDNRILSETKSMLEEQLEGCRKRTEQIVELEAEILKCQAKMNEAVLEKDNDKNMIQHLLEENAQLHVEKKSSMEELSHVQIELNNIRCQSALTHHSLQDQLNADAQSRLLHLELENRRLSQIVDQQKADATSKQLEKELEREKQRNSNLEDKLQDLESNREWTELKIAKLVARKQELEKIVKSLQEKIDLNQLNQSKIESLEQSNVGLNAENQRLHRALDAAQTQVQEIQQEMQSLESENQKLIKTTDGLKLSVRKLHELEKESTDLETENHRLQQEKKCMDKENTRLKTAVEMKDSALEEFSSRSSSLERQNKQMAKELENLSSATQRVRELEKENKEMEQHLSLTKDTLSSLRQDFVSEKIQNQRLSVEMERLTFQVQKPTTPDAVEEGYEKPEKTERSSSSQSVTCSCKDEREDPPCKIVSTNSENVRVAGEGEELNGEQSMFKENLGPGNSPKEMFILKTLISELERKSVLSEEENQNLRNQATTLRDQNAALISQADALQQRLSSVNRQNSEMHAKLAKAEVEATLLASQNNSLASQNSGLQGQVSLLEDECNQLKGIISDLHDSQKSLVGAHESLQQFHEQLTREYEGLASNYSTLKAGHRNLKLEYNAIKEKLEASISQEEMMMIKEVLDDSPRASSKSLTTMQMQNTKLKEHAKSVKDEVERLQTEYKTLQSTHKSLKAENNELKLKFTKVQGELTESRDANASLDIQISKLTSYCEGLNQSNAFLNEERLSLIRNITSLLTEYHDLLAKTCDMKDDSFLKEKLKELDRQREKLELRLQGHFKCLDKMPKKPPLPHSLYRSMRRTKSDQFSCASQMNHISGKEETHSDPTSMATSQDLGHDDSLVRDVGSSLTNNSPLVEECPIPNPVTSPSHASQSSRSTTVENYTTVNFVTNLTKGPTQPDTSTSNGNFVREASSFRHRPQSMFYGEGSGTPVFGSIMPRSGLRCSRNYGKQQQQRLPAATSGDTATCDNTYDSDETGSLRRSESSPLRMAPDSEQRQKTTPGNGSTPRDKSGKSAIWDFGEAYGNKGLLMDENLYRFSLMLALKELHGEVGVAIQIEISQYDEKLRRAAVKIEKKDLVKVWSSLTLFSQYSGHVCAFRIHQITETPLLSANQSRYSVKETDENIEIN